MSTPAGSPLKISVALCTHNGAQFIREQLLSVLEQTMAPMEIVLSDDDSSDDTVARAEETVELWKQANPNNLVAFRVIHNRPALRVAKNFESAILSCTGDLIALCDQDDVWQPDRLALLTEIFDERPDVNLVHSDARLVDSRGEPLGELLLDTLRVSAWERESINSGNAARVFVRRNLVTGATAIVRGDFARATMPVPDGWIHDEWLAMIASLQGAIVLDSRALIDYRQHENNQIGASSLGFRGKLGRLREPRTARNERLLRRATSLVERLSSESESPENVRELVNGKLAHETFRSSLPAFRLARIVPVTIAAARGRYSRFGLGAQDVLRDIVQPAL